MWCEGCHASPPPIHEFQEPGRKQATFHYERGNTLARTHCTVVVRDSIVVMHSIVVMDSIVVMHSIVVMDSIVVMELASDSTCTLLLHPGDRVQVS